MLHFTKTTASYHHWSWGKEFKWSSNHCSPRDTKTLRETSCGETTVPTKRHYKGRRGFIFIFLWGKGTECHAVNWKKNQKSKVSYFLCFLAAFIWTVSHSISCLPRDFVHLTCSAVHKYFTISWIDKPECVWPEATKTKSEKWQKRDRVACSVRTGEELRGMSLRSRRFDGWATDELLTESGWLHLSTSMSLSDTNKWTNTQTNTHTPVKPSGVTLYIHCRPRVYKHTHTSERIHTWPLILCDRWSDVSVSTWSAVAPVDILTPSCPRLNPWGHLRKHVSHDYLHFNGTILEMHASTHTHTP